MSDFRNNVAETLFGNTTPQPGVGKSNMYSKFKNVTYGPHATRTTLSGPLSKSWLFEVCDSENGKIEDSFTLVLPPQSITIKEPQRVSVVKTFENAFIDDYGPDNLQITLKGISGTAHAFPTFETRGAQGEWSDIGSAVTSIEANNGRRFQRASTSGYNGRDAFYKFRNAIMRYKDKDKWDTKELRVYDLADEQGYKCVLLDFTLDRSLDKPLHYSFTINLLVYQRLEKSRRIRKQVITFSEDPLSGLDTIDGLLDKIESFYADVKAIVNVTALLKAKALELRTRVNDFLTDTTGVLMSPLSISKNLIDTAFSAVGIIYDAYRAGKITVERYARADEMFRDVLNKGLKIYGWQISEGWKASKIAYIETGGELDVTEDLPERDPIDETYEYSGLQTHIVGGDETLQSMARDELGDSSLWVYIAVINDGIDSNDDLIPGETIYIPTKVSPGDATNKEKYIASENPISDPYGTDISLDSNGDIVVQENSDFGLVTGIENVKQAVDLRLNTLEGSMIKHSTFGIASIGLAGTEMAIKYVKMAVRASLVEDSRILSVDNLVVSIEGDSLYISLTVRISGVSEVLPVTVIL